MVTEFCFTVPDQPGELAKVAQALGDAGVNIEGFSETSTSGPTAFFRLVVDNEEGAKAALQGAGISFQTNEAFLLTLDNKPGVLANLATKLGDAGVNIDSFYVTMQGKQVLGVDNVNAAKGILG